jgi:hypothetical protein
MVNLSIANLNPLSMLGVVLSNKQLLFNHRCNPFTDNLCMDNSLFKDGVSKHRQRVEVGYRQVDNKQVASVVDLDRLEAAWAFVPGKLVVVQVVLPYLR